MPFQSSDSLVKPCIGRSMSLSQGHIDPATLTAIFHYQEQVESDNVWRTVEREQVLTEGTHYALDAKVGTITLLDHRRWKKKSTWRMTDMVESLLYKGQVKHPQYVRMEFEYYAPTPVEPSTDADWDKTNREAKRRLGYDVLEYGMDL